MVAALIAIVIAIFVWWASTGAVMLIARRFADEPRAMLAGASAVALVGLVALYLGARTPTHGGAYAGFLGAIALWAWHELTFLSGALTGPRRAACPVGLSGTARFRAAFETIRDHELAILASAVLVAGLTLGGENMTGFYVFLVLWVMRISAKLNVFFGAPHSVSALIPARLGYLTTYFRTDRTSPALPLTIVLASAALALTVWGAAGATETYRIVGTALVAAFLALAILEHLFLMLPVSDSALWTWILPKAEHAEEAQPVSVPTKTIPQSSEEPARSRVA